MQMYLEGRWQDRPAKIEVINPYDESVVDTVPDGTPDDIGRAVAAAVDGAVAMRHLPGYERFVILDRAARLLDERTEEFAQTISREAGKTLRESRTEVSRAVQTLQLSGEEAKRLTGEVLPLDGAPNGADKLGFTLRVPCGVVAAISPFNFPLNLVCHKVGPALAAGNAVLLKPASNTPLSAIKLVEILLEAGLPELGVQVVTGRGGALGQAICDDDRVRKITFTGSKEVGEKICRAAGIKRVTMELGSNCPLIIMPDADLDQVVAATLASGYANAGQVCISAQRIIALRPVYSDFIDMLRDEVSRLVWGDQLDEQTSMGPMIRASEAQRVGAWIDEAVSGGARLVTGGSYEGARFAPTILADAQPGMKVCREELFGPAVATLAAQDVDEAIRLASDSDYGLSAAIYTNNLTWALRFAREVPSGNLHINGGPGWRADLMPYGGLKHSGLGKEGPKYAIEEMTEVKAVVFH